MSQLKQTNHAVVTRDEWLASRKALLAKEKEHINQREELAKERRQLPWVKMEKDYTLEGVDGPEKFSSLFGDNSQLFVQHFMFAPEWEEGCVGCSFKADHVDSALLHLQNHDVSFVSVSHAPIEKIEAFKKRMGWQFKWLSSYNSDFNYDFNVSFTPEQIATGKVFYDFAEQDFESSELPGSSVFYKDKDGTIYHTYSSYGNGDEGLVGAYMYLDMMPLGRNENGPHHDLRDWVKHHDRYQKKANLDSSALYRSKK